MVDWLLRMIYFSGPSWHGWGFWEGRSPAEICAALTGVASAVWERPAAALECLDLIERKYMAFVISVVLVLMGYILWRVFEIGVIRRLDPHTVAIAAIATALSAHSNAKEEKRWQPMSSGRPPGLLAERPSST